MTVTLEFTHQTGAKPVAPGLDALATTPRSFMRGATIAIVLETPDISPQRYLFQDGALDAVSPMGQEGAAPLVTVRGSTILCCLLVTGVLDQVDFVALDGSIEAPGIVELSLSSWLLCGRDVVEFWSPTFADRLNTYRLLDPRAVDRVAELKGWL